MCQSRRQRGARASLCRTWPKGRCPVHVYIGRAAAQRTLSSSCNESAQKTNAVRASGSPSDHQTESRTRGSDVIGAKLSVRRHTLSVTPTAPRDFERRIQSAVNASSSAAVKAASAKGFSGVFARTMRPERRPKYSISYEPLGDAHAQRSLAMTAETRQLGRLRSTYSILEPSASKAHFTQRPCASYQKLAVSSDTTS